MHARVCVRASSHMTMMMMVVLLQMMMMSSILACRPVGVIPLKVKLIMQ